MNKKLIALNEKRNELQDLVAVIKNPYRNTLLNVYEIIYALQKASAGVLTLEIVNTEIAWITSSGLTDSHKTKAICEVNELITPEMVSTEIARIVSPGYKVERKDWAIRGLFKKVPDNKRAKAVIQYCITQLSKEAPHNFNNLQKLSNLVKGFLVEYNLELLIMSRGKVNTHIRAHFEPKDRLMARQLIKLHREAAVRAVEDSYDTVEERDFDSAFLTKSVIEIVSGFTQFNNTPKTA